MSNALRPRVLLGRHLPVIALGAVAALVAGIAPAVADTVPVTVTVVSANANGRTLSVKNFDGSASPTLSGTQSGFLADVSDAAYVNRGYTVSAVMSKLYKFDGTNYDCSTSIPSANVTIKEPGLVDLSGLSAATTPVLNLTGSVAGSALPAGTTAVGLAQTLTQTQLAGATGVVGAATANLPIQSTKGSATAQAFTAPAAAGTGTGCSDSGSGATAVPLLTGVSNLNAVQTYVSGLIPSAPVSGYSSYITSTAVRSAAASALTGLSSTLLANDTLSGVNGSLNRITNLVQTGLYQTSPVVTIDTTGVASGQYKGVMTVTLADNVN